MNLSLNLLLSIRDEFEKKMIYFSQIIIYEKMSYSIIKLKSSPILHSIANLEREAIEYYLFIDEIDRIIGNHLLIRKGNY